MAIPKIYYLCQQCGYESSKWLGRCPQCKAWNSFSEEFRGSSRGQGRLPVDSVPVHPVTLGEISTEEGLVICSTIDEWDRVLGGGIVAGSLILLAGDPGIGKSTLLMQVMGMLAERLTVVYVSGEESPRQLKLRAERLRLRAPGLRIIFETSVEVIEEVLRSLCPAVTVIDSIQTLHSQHVPTAPGSINQVRHCATVLMNLAKENAMGIIMVGHVTKEGVIAGPRVLEHLVDAVLYLEGDRSHTFRLLRAVKNRFGSTNEIGVFEMKEEGLREVGNPSQLLLAERPVGVSGSVVLCAMEGTRPLLVEVQALVTPSSWPQPKRTSIGIDHNRLSLLLAVLEKKLGFEFSSQDVFVNVAGGIRLQEPAGDLAVVTALVSSYLDRALPPGLVAWGEVGLAGEVRGVSHGALRVGEAQKLGFDAHLIPYTNANQLRTQFELDFIAVRSLKEMLEYLFE